MAKETSKSVARLAARFLSGELKKLTREQQLSMAGSLVSQAEREAEGVKAWGYVLQDGTLGNNVWFSPSKDKRSIPVIITRRTRRHK